MPPIRNKPTELLERIPPYQKPASVEDGPVVIMYNTKQAGICRARLHSLQDWVEAGY